MKINTLQTQTQITPTALFNAGAFLGNAKKSNTENAASYRSKDGRSAFKRQQQGHGRPQSAQVIAAAGTAATKISFAELLKKQFQATEVEIPRNFDHRSALQATNHGKAKAGVSESHAVEFLIDYWA